MKFFKYGITLERLKAEDIELVRQWRNSNAVRLNMNYRDIISPEQQAEWFKSINNLFCHYVIIHYQGEKIGLLNDKHIDWESRSSESGIFFGRSEYINSMVPALVSVAGIETMFYILGWHKQYASILRNNVKAIDFNSQLGYILCEGQEDLDLQKFELTLESFEKKAKKIRKAVRLSAGNETCGKILLEPEDFQIGIAQKVESLIHQSPRPIHREESGEGIWYMEINETHNFQKLYNQ